MIAADPLGTGLVAGLARPGGDTTGFAILSTELTAKRLELLKEVMPQTARIAILQNPGNSAHPIFLDEIQPVANSLNLTYRIFEACGSGQPMLSLYWMILLSSPIERSWQSRPRDTVCRLSADSRR
jgi:hypothetical protein